VIGTLKKQPISARPGCTHYAEIFALQRPALDRVEEEEPCASIMINLMKYLVQGPLQLQ
jgi:hypothetical protein